MVNPPRKFGTCCSESSRFARLQIMIAQSSDGLVDDATTEIKYPTSAKSKESYIKNSIIKKEYNAQMGLQMYAISIKKKDIFRRSKF